MYLKTINIVDCYCFSVTLAQIKGLVEVKNSRTVGKFFVQSPNQSRSEFLSFYF